MKRINAIALGIGIILAAVSSWGHGLHHLSDRETQEYAAVLAKLSEMGAKLHPPNEKPADATGEADDQNGDDPLKFFADDDESAGPFVELFGERHYLDSAVQEALIELLTDLAMHNPDGFCPPRSYWDKFRHFLTQQIVTKHFWVELKANFIPNVFDVLELLVRGGPVLAIPYGLAETADNFLGHFGCVAINAFFLKFNRDLNFVLKALFDNGIVPRSAKQRLRAAYRGHRLARDQAAAERWVTDADRGVNVRWGDFADGVAGTGSPFEDFVAESNLWATAFKVRNKSQRRSPRRTKGRPIKPSHLCFGAGCGESHGISSAASEESDAAADLESNMEEIAEAVNDWPSKHGVEYMAAYEAALRRTLAPGTFDKRRFQWHIELVYYLKKFDLQLKGHKVIVNQWLRSPRNAKVKGRLATYSRLRMMLMSQGKVVDRLIENLMLYTSSERRPSDNTIVSLARGMVDIERLNFELSQKLYSMKADDESRDQIKKLRAEMRKVHKKLVSIRRGRLDPLEKRGQQNVVAGKACAATF